MADETVRDMGRTALTGHGALEGYMSTLEVYLELAEAQSAGAEPEELLSSLSKLLPGMHRYARMVPIGQARAASCEARYSALRGNRAAALKALRRSLNAAQAHDLPYDQALAHLWLARLAPSSTDPKLLWPDARVHYAAARQLFQRIGAADSTPAT